MLIYDGPADTLKTAVAGAAGLWSPYIERFIAGVLVLGASESQWPRSMRERVEGRVLGRALAHEIGHFVLRSPAHVAHGLRAADTVGQRNGRPLATPLRALPRRGRAAAGGAAMRSHWPEVRGSVRLPRRQPQFTSRLGAAAGYVPASRAAHSDPLQVI